MNKKNFTKSAISVEQQLGLLQKRGLTVLDKQKAIQSLSTVSFHRLSAYFYAYEKNPSEGTFKPNSTFQHIWDLYVFDRQLRLLVLDALERIEIAIRTALTNTLAVKYDPWWYLDENIFKSNWIVSSNQSQRSPKDIFLTELNSACNNKRHNDEIRHYYDKYDQPSCPPSWIVLEFLSFGKCTSLFRYLRSRQDKASISDVFKLHHKIFESALEPLRYTRNLCAHHSRLWGRWFVYKPRYLKELKIIGCKPGTLKEQLALLYFLHKQISPNSSWKQRLYTLFDENKELPINFSISGFQQNWENDPFWDL